MRFTSPACFILGLAQSAATADLNGLFSMQETHVVAKRIISAAQHDSIDVYSLPFATAALASIKSIHAEAVFIPSALANATTVDVHSHIVPDWYHAVVPFTAQNPTPNWTLAGHLEFMAANGIGHAVLSISAPGSGVYPGDEKKTAALARLLNEYLAALVRKVPQHFSFFAVTPLPYTKAALKEKAYAMDRLHAAGLGLLSNHEGYYLGNPAFKALFASLNSTTGKPSIAFVHPNEECVRLSNGSLISANPTRTPEGIVELYFETARTFMDLTTSRTIANFTRVDWVVPHAGGSFPSILDRFITSQPPDIIAPSMAAFRTRFWWDAAGPVFPHQIKGLLGYGIPTTQLLYGSDFPYAPIFTYPLEISAIGNASFLTTTEKTGVFRDNSRRLFGQN